MSLMQKQYWAVKRVYWSNVSGVGSFMFGGLYVALGGVAPYSSLVFSFVITVVRMVRASDILQIAFVTLVLLSGPCVRSFCARFRVAVLRPRAWQLPLCARRSGLRKVAV